MRLQEQLLFVFFKFIFLAFQYGGIVGDANKPNCRSQRKLGSQTTDYGSCNKGPGP